MHESRQADCQISLIIPCYNAGRYIAEALQSVLSQSMVPDEILVVDDGSSDDSAHIVRSFDAVRLISQPNQGAASALNEGLANTSGALVTFLDADDLWPSDSLEKRVESLMASPDHDYVYGRMTQFVSPELEGMIVVPPEILAGGSARVGGGTLVRRRVFDRVGGFNRDITHGYTMEWMGKVESTGHQGLKIDSVVLHRRIHDRNSVHQEEQLRKSYLQALRSSLAHKRALSQ